MKKKLVTLFSLFALVISSLLFLPTINSYAASEIKNEVSSTWLYDVEADTSPYKSNTPAGLTSGYGRFLLGEENVELTSTAYSGYKFVGWSVTSLENTSGGAVFVDANGLDENGTKSVTVSETKMTITCLDTDEDGYLDTSNLMVEQVAEHLQVNAVFDCMYYNLDVTDVVLATGMLNTTNYHSVSLTNGDELYYTSEVDGLYDGAIVYSAEKNAYFYYGELNVDGTNVYKSHERDDSTGANYGVNYLRGGFRISSQADINFVVNITDSISDSVNIDVTGFNQLSDGAIQTGTTTFSKTQDAYLRTSEFTLGLQVVDAKDKTNTLTLDYDKLYVANITTFVDGSNMDATLRTKLLEKVQVNNVFSTISKAEAKYFVKDASDNDGIGLRVTVPQKITENIEGVTYEYYNLDTLNGANASSYTYSNGEINADFDIEIKYLSIEYNVKFEFRLYDANSNSLKDGDGEFNLEPNFNLRRGESRLVEKTDASNNVGYSFYGFASSSYSYERNSSIPVEIDENKPRNQTILMIFEKIDYTIVFKNYDNIHLVNDESNIYPVDRVTLTLNRGNVFTTETIESGELRNAGGEFRFDNIYNINDEIELSLALNNGFAINGYRFKVDETLFTFTDNINCVLNAEFLSNYATSENEIEIYIEENFNSYSFVYYIEASDDTPSGVAKIMATLSVVYNEETISIDDAIENELVVIEKTDERHAIVFNNLKLYDKVTLIADGNQDSYLDDDNQTIEFYYVFNRLTENNKTNFTPDSNDGTHVEYTVTITRNDASMRVIYSRPDARLIVSLNNDSAYDITNLRLTENGETLEVSASTGMIEVRITAGATIGLTLNPTGESADRLYNFGYTLDNISLESNGISNILRANEYGGYEFTASSSIQRLTLNFRELVYNLSVDQYYDDGTRLGNVVFGSDNYLPLTVSERNIVFNMPRGYYASHIYFVNGSAESEYEIAQDNSHQGSEFNYSLTEDELVSIVRRHQVTADGNSILNMKVVYTIHTYTIEIEFGLTNPKNFSYDSQVIYPDMSSEYTFNGAQVNAESVRTPSMVQFINIPYGANNLSIHVSGDTQKGLSVYGWAVNEFNDAPSSILYPGSTLTELNFRDAITSDSKFYYKLTYDSYEVRVVADDAMHGNPSVAVNGRINDNLPTVNTISLFDELVISMNASNTYRFSRMIYNQNQGAVQQVYTCYERYVYFSEDDWYADYITLYTYREGEGYVRNSSSVYDPDTEYYTARVNSYRDGLFNVANYDVVNGCITFYIEYVDKEIIIYNNNGTYNSNNLQIGDLDIPPRDYCEISMEVTHADGSTELVPNTNMVSTLDRSVEITITMNSVVVDGEEYNLSLGVLLVQVLMQNNLYTYNQLDDNTYIVSFNINDVIDYLPDSGLLTINYSYLVTNKRVTITTNVDDPSFYNNNGEYRFRTVYNNSAYGFGNTVIDSQGKVSLSNDMRFLGKSLYSYENAHSQYFEVYDIKAYLPRKNTLDENMTDENGDLIAGEEIPFSQFRHYGITFKDYGAVDFDLKEALSLGFDVRFIDSLVIKLQIQPIIYYNYDSLEDNAYVFTSIFKHDSNGDGIAQKLNVGSSTSDHIHMDSFIYDFLGEDGVKYYDANDGMNIPVTPMNVGRYRVELNFGEKSNYEWLKDIELTYSIYYDITPKEVSLTYDIKDRTFSKTYDGTSGYNADSLLQYLVFTTGSDLVVGYTGTNRFELNLSNIACAITYTGEGDIQISTASANDDTFRNLYLTGINLVNNPFNNNFSLSNDNVLMLNVFKILRKEITITGVGVYDKVYDGLNTAVIDENSEISLRGLVDGDVVSVDKSKIGLQFDDVEIGADKRITVSAQEALISSGNNHENDYENYVLRPSAVFATIYPYKISTTVEGYGVVTIYNERGLTDHTKANLIPIGAELGVGIIVADSGEYADMYSNISRHMDNNNVFAIGYKLSFVRGSTSSNVSDELYLSVPNVDRLTGAIWLTGAESGRLEYVDSDGYVRIDLKQIEGDVSTIILLKQRILLQLWQILLIIFAILLIIAVIIIIFIVVRKKKAKDYGKYDKI